MDLANSRRGALHGKGLAAAVHDALSPRDGRVLPAAAGQHNTRTPKDAHKQTPSPSQPHAAGQCTCSSAPASSSCTPQTAREHNMRTSRVRQNAVHAGSSTRQAWQASSHLVPPGARHGPGRRAVRGGLSNCDPCRGALVGYAASRGCAGCVVTQAYPGTALSRPAAHRTLPPRSLPLACDRKPS